MHTDTSRRQERIDDAEDLTSPSAGWRAVYAAMGVPSDGAAGVDATSKPRTDHTLDEYADRASARSSNRVEGGGRHAVPSD